MFTVFLDLDGVVCDLITGIENLRNVKLDRTQYSIDFENKIGMPEKEFWDNMSASNWADLPKMKDADKILEIVRPYKPVILSAHPGYGVANSIAGKIRWVEMNMPDYYREDRWFFGRGKNKLAHPKAILIDDHEYNTDRWTKAGGISILVPRPWNKYGKIGLNTIIYIKNQLRLLDIIGGY